MEVFDVISHLVVSSNGCVLCMHVTKNQTQSTVSNVAVEISMDFYRIHQGAFKSLICFTQEIRIFSCCFQKFSHDFFAYNYFQLNFVHRKIH